jgi:hypothetical protein
MKSFMIFFLISSVFSTPLFSQKVFTTNHVSQAEVLLYETKRKSEADILIYKVDYTSQVNPAEGLWLDVAYTSQADWRVFWTKYRSQADCIVYFVEYRSQAQKNTCYLNCKGRK